MELSMYDGISTSLYGIKKTMEFFLALNVRH